MKKTFIYSILKGKCPVCRVGDAFESKNLYDLKKIDKMNKNCSNCGHKFEKEPGFWYGAMFVSYGLTVGISVFTFLLTYIIYNNASVWVYISSISIMAVLVAPFNFRTSRMLWMNLFSKYDSKKSIKNLIKNEQI